MAVRRYRKKPVVIEAIRFSGSNVGEVAAFMDWSTDEDYEGNYDSMVIPTLEGDMEAVAGDFVIKGVEGEFYPCKPHVFEKSYEEVEA